MMQNVFSNIVPAYSGWVETLAEVLSAVGRNKKSWRLLAYMTEDGYEIYEKKSRKIKSLGTWKKTSDAKDIGRLKKKLRKARANKAGGAFLWLSGGNVLQKNIKLPGGAADVLEPVIKNQMRRLVPWSEEDTCFSYQINNEKSSSGELDITVVAASKGYIINAIDELSELNFKTSAIEFSESVESKTSLELFRSDNDASQQNIKVINRTIICFAVISIGISVSGIFNLTEKFGRYQQSSIKLENARSTIAELKKRNTENVRLTAQKSFLIRKKQESLPLVMVLNDLSKTIPDNAWLQKMEVSGDTVTINGNATDTPGLVKVLEASPVFGKVRFSAPTTRVGVADLETFSIIADISDSQDKKVKSQ